MYSAHAAPRPYLKIRPENQAKPAYSSPLASSIISEGSKEVTKGGSGVQMVLTIETHDPSAKDVCDGFTCTNITLTGVCHPASLYCLRVFPTARFKSSITMDDEDTDYPVCRSTTLANIFRDIQVWQVDGQKRCGPPPVGEQTIPRSNDAKKAPGSYYCDACGK
ncbi:hypothetical protein BASA62_005116 [Batrachochytrium salamandrivorans]|nr:hypothetical protein BASA62_005116 [Batrachochytrium salamandrivorans]